MVISKGQSKGQISGEADVMVIPLGVCMTTSKNCQTSVSEPVFEIV